MGCIVKLSKARDGTHKYKVIITCGCVGDKVETCPNKKTLYFGSKGASDYTKHKDKERKKRYIDRHEAREDWTKAGIKTAGFWSRWILWNKPTIEESIKNVENRFNIKII